MGFQQVEEQAFQLQADAQGPKRLANLDKNLARRLTRGPKKSHPPEKKSLLQSGSGFATLKH
jgi:hypothetical protein